jgi:CRISPR-associated endonuclease Cas1
MQDKTTELATITSRNGVVTLTGYGLRVRVERGYLEVSDGIADQRRTGRFHKTDRSLKRLIILGHTGSITFDALRWLHDAGVSFTQIDADANVLVLSAALGRNDGRLRRAQALALHNGAALEIAKQLIEQKLLGQARVLTEIEGTYEAAQRIIKIRERIALAKNADHVRVLEAEAAKLYWEQWSQVSMQFVKKDIRRVPDHWRTFNQRVSQLSLSPRRAINPANALLNYLYAILEVECTLALHQVGLDPGLGVLHVDQRGRDSLSLDIIEAVRPEVDSFVLNTLTDQSFRKADFLETTEGGCRILPPLTERLTQTAQRWADVVAPHAEQTAQTLMDSTGEDRSIVLSTPLTQSNRSAGRHRLGQAQAKATPTPRKPRLLVPRCKACGDNLPDSDRTYCDNCLPEQRREQIREFAQTGPKRLAELRAAGRDPAHTDKANEQRRNTQLKHVEEKLRWAAREHGFDPKAFEREIRPHLANVPLGRISEATGLSKPYCSVIRSGKGTPDPRHWRALAELIASGPADSS